MEVDAGSSKSVSGVTVGATPPGITAPVAAAAPAGGRGAGRGGRGGGGQGAGGGGGGNALTAASAALVGAMNAMQSADVQPTTNQLKSVTTAQASATAALAAWSAIRTIDLPAMNAKLKAAGLAAIDVK